MALTLGTNCGFVTTAPTADPVGSNAVIDDRSWAMRHTAPTGAIRITQVGWYADNATEAANFQMGLYADDGGSDPAARLAVTADTAKGTTSGWKTVTVDWSISAGTVYWLAVQLDNTATATNGNTATPSGAGFAIDAAQSALANPWGTSDSTDASGMMAIYAVYAVSTSPPHHAQLYSGPTVTGLEKVVRDSNDFCEKYGA